MEKKISPLKGIDKKLIRKHKEIKHASFEISFLKKLFFLRFLQVLEALESSEKLVGFVSTKSGTYKFPWCRVIAKNPGGESFFPSTVYCLNNTIAGPRFSIPDLRIRLYNFNPKKLGFVQVFASFVIGSCRFV